MASCRADLLRLPHHGGTRNDLHRHHDRRGVSPLATALVRVSLVPVASDASLAVSLYCERSRLGGGRGRAAAVAGLWLAEDGRRNLGQCGGGRDCVYHTG